MDSKITQLLENALSLLKKVRNLENLEQKDLARFYMVNREIINKETELAHLTLERNEKKQKEHARILGDMERGESKYSIRFSDCRTGDEEWWAKLRERFPYEFRALDSIEKDILRKQQIIRNLKDSLKGNALRINNILAKITAATYSIEQYLKEARNPAAGDPEMATLLAMESKDFLDGVEIFMHELLDVTQKIDGILRKMSQATDFQADDSRAANLPTGPKQADSRNGIVAGTEEIYAAIRNTERTYEVFVASEYDRTASAIKKLESAIDIEKSKFIFPYRIFGTPGIRTVVLDTSFFAELYRTIKNRAIGVPESILSMKFLIPREVVNEVRNISRGGKISVEFFRKVCEKLNVQTFSLSGTDHSRNLIIGRWLETDKGREEVSRSGRARAVDHFIGTADYAICRFLIESRISAYVLTEDIDIRKILGGEGLFVCLKAKDLQPA